MTITPSTGEPLRIAIVVGSTRPGRKARAVAEWAQGVAVERGDATFEILDVADFNLPLFDEPAPPMSGKVAHEHTRVWADAVARFDGYVFVTPEYNHATSAALKNAIDYLWSEWNDKACGFIGYGAAGGHRAVENLRLVLGELKVADVRTAVALSLADDFTEYTDFTPRERNVQTLTTMLDELLAWAGALRGVRR